MSDGLENNSDGTQPRRDKAAMGLRVAAAPAAAVVISPAAARSIAPLHITRLARGHDAGLRPHLSICMRR